MRQLLILGLILLTAVIAFGAPNRVVTLRTDNTVVIRGEVSPASMADAEQRLIDIVLKRAKNDTTYIVLDSPGGSIDSGEEFIQFAKLIPNVETISLFAASMASAIVEGLPGRRLVAENGTLMFHRAKGGLQGQFEDGEIETRLSYAKSIVRSMEVRSSARMSMTLDAYKSAVKDEYWLYGAGAVSKNAADEVIDVACSRQLIEQKDITTITIMGMFTLDVESSGCPLLKSMKPVKEDPEAKSRISTYLETYTRNGVFR